MKIGILTYHRAVNYGAFLQAYALKSFLEGLGHEAGFVDYWPQEHKKRYRLFDNSTNLKLLFRNLLLAYKRYPRYKRFKKDQMQYLGIPERPVYGSVRQLEQIGKQYDLIIYGSDQIWWKSRLDTNGFDPVYWGEFISKNIKKITYAASMGVISLTDSDKRYISNCLNAFSHISVRETQLMEVLQPLTGKKICTVLDPTLLVPSSFWESKCLKDAPVKGKYILYYRMMSDERADVFANETGRILNMPVITIIGHIGSYKVDRINSVTGPFSFVTLIRNAQYVISTSFHGVAMSIQFRKEFYAMGMNRNSDRVYSLLTLLGIENRMADSVPANFSERIDYTRVHSRLSDLQKESSDFLISSILS